MRLPAVSTYSLNLQLLTAISQPVSNTAACRLCLYVSSFTAPYKIHTQPDANKCQQGHSSPSNVLIGESTGQLVGLHSGDDIPLELEALGMRDNPCIIALLLQDSFPSRHPFVLVPC